MKNKIFKHMALLLGLFYVGCCLANQTVWAQKIQYFGPTKTIVKLDPFSGIPESDIPFDRFFYIRTYIPNDDPEPKAAIFQLKIQDDPIQSPVFRANEDTAKPEVRGYKAFDILVSPLKPGKTYTFSTYPPMKKAFLTKFAKAFILLSNSNESEAQKIIDIVAVEKRSVGDTRLVSMDEMKEYYKVHLEALIKAEVTAGTSEANMIDKLVIELRKENLIDSPDIEEKTPSLIFYDQVPLKLTTLSSKLETRAGVYVQPDFGLVYYGLGGGGKGFTVNTAFHGVTPYVGISILARPFDGDIPLRYINQYNPIGFIRRFSLQLGLTLGNLAKDGYRANAYGSFNPMAGVGFRLTNTFKINGGVILYQKINNNPVIETRSIKGIGYVGIGVDLRIRDILKDVGKLFGTAK